MENKIATRDQNLQSVHLLSRELEALSSEQICKVPEIDLDKVLMTAVHKAFRDKGQEVDPNQMDHIVDNLLPTVLKSCPFIRIAEIPIAIEKGILGDYGDYFGLNVVTFTNFIKSHYASEKRAKIAKQTMYEEEEKEPPSEQEILEKDKQLLSYAFEQYKKSGYYEDHGNYMYKVAVKKLGLFSLSAERQKEYLDNGRAKAVEKLKTELIQKPHERRRITSCIQQAGAMEKGSEGVKLVYKESLQLALMGWFKDLVESGIEITELLTKE
ncbi:hypothetical protein BC792_12759 [Sphingobacterium allocomposti]|uniref:Uncharacterized protein n=1 Tax=Sphingobacterium allocomposti TaxID=415956 RepID=A0A5S5D2H2_9SPHI|nr:hypothetical protein [Sphingobacterium composti Yoo et al. 2007 non Ten et al. 2007]TYP89458.1 hypothetical protein BC792_12759 [Sphingobacterium composti Yoo et al. 2007 non Ten et al. 2007]